MFEGVKIRRLKQDIELSRLAVEKKGIEDLEKLIQEATLIQPEADESGWELLGGDNTNRTLDAEDQENLKAQVTKAYYKTAHGRNIIRLFEKYVTGRGFSIDPKSRLPQVKDVWENFWRLNNLDLKKKEIVRRAMRDGECFIRFFKDETTGMIDIRFMIAQKVKDPDDKVAQEKAHNTSISEGIEVSADDVEDVVAYWYKGVSIPAEEVMHIKILVDSDIRRGRSLLEPILEYIWMYKDWLQDRMKLNKIRATVALIKKVKGTPTQAANIKSDQETISRVNPNGTPMQKAPVGVSVITTNQGVDYDLKAPNLQAGDVQHDGRTILLSIAAGVSLPEFMITSDASNGNYASTMIAEGPAVMEFEDWQDFFAIYFQKMYAMIIQYNIDKGNIPNFEVVTIRKSEKQEDGTIKIIETEEKIPVSTEASITFPDIVSRDIQAETNAIVTVLREGLCSEHTACSRLDLDYDNEQELIRQEEEEEEEDSGEPTEEDDAEMEDEPEEETEPDEDADTKS